MVPTALVFAAWDVAVIGRDHWSFSDRYTTGWELPFGLPVEELVFFVVIPVCGLLTPGSGPAPARPPRRRVARNRRPTRA